MPVTSARTSWILTPAPRPAARLRLFCFSHAGGGASSYARWPSLLPADVEVCAVQMPGREYRLSEPPITDWNEAMGRLAEALSPWMDRPYAFFGHSLGAALAFELACRLGGQRAGLVHLFVSGRSAPHLPPSRPPTYDLPQVEFVRELRHWMGERVPFLEDPEFLDAFLPLLRADFRLSETYASREIVRLGVPITAYGGVDDERIPWAGIDAWHLHTSAGFQRVMFPGGHFFVNEQRPDVLSHVLGALQVTLAPPR
jgi:medium-chain acyl-[acyl-carrier-protein] hydrolase